LVVDIGRDAGLVHAREVEWIVVIPVRGTVSEGRIRKGTSNRRLHTLDFNNWLAPVVPSVSRDSSKRSARIVAALTFVDLVTGQQEMELDPYYFSAKYRN